MLYYVSLAYYDYCYQFFFALKKSGGGGMAPMASPGFAGPDMHFIILLLKSHVIDSHIYPITHM